MTAQPQRKDDRLWGGRFEREPDKKFDAFQRSFSFDRRLLPNETAVDRAWAKALQAVAISAAAEVHDTLLALDDLERRLRNDPSFLEGSTAEDVHHFVESALVHELGALGWKLHTGRSRNELVATDFRLFVKDAAASVQSALFELLSAFLEQAKTNIGLPMAGMTHMQHAQPILLSHFLLAHAEAFSRDLTRLQHAAETADACPMGSGALAGNSFGIDRNAVARELGFSRITANSLDAVSDREFALDYLFALATTKFNAERLRAAAANPVLLATEAADYLVHKGIPFRQAHDIVGKVLREAEKQNVPWTSLPLETLKKISPAFEPDFAATLSLDAALASKNVPGGTAPESVRAAISDLQNRITKLSTNLSNTKRGATP